MTKPGDHRETARVLLRNRQGDYLLLLTHFDPEVQLPARWITPGGGIEPQEDVRVAAIRELFEETGLTVREEELGEPVAKTSGEWIWGNEIDSHTYIDTFFELFTDEFEIDTSNWTDDEKRDVLDIRWWTKDEIISSQESFGPHDLVEIIMNR